MIGLITGHFRRPQFYGIFLTSFPFFVSNPSAGDFSEFLNKICSLRLLEKKQSFEEKPAKKKKKMI